MHNHNAKNHLPHCAQATTPNQTHPSATSSTSSLLLPLFSFFSSSLLSQRHAHFRNCCIVRSAHLNALQVQPTVRGQPLGCVLVSLGLPPPAELVQSTQLHGRGVATLNSHGVNRLATKLRYQSNNAFIHLFISLFLAKFANFAITPNVAALWQPCANYHELNQLLLIIVQNSTNISKLLLPIWCVCVYLEI